MVECETAAGELERYVAKESVTPANAKRIAKIVVDARKAKESDSAILDRLAEVGVAAPDVPLVIDAVEKGFKHGTLSVVSGGLSSADIPYGENPLFDTAFRMGRSAMRWSSPGWVLVRMVLPIIVALAIIAGIVFYAIAT